MRINAKEMYLNYVIIFFLQICFHELLVESNLCGVRWARWSWVLGLYLQHLEGAIWGLFLAEELLNLILQFSGSFWELPNAL